MYPIRKRNTNFVAVMSELRKMKGIYLHKVRYSDHSAIAKIYTNEAGMQSFIIRGVGKTAKNKKNGLLQPLTLLDIVAYINPKKDIHHIKEINLAYHFKNLQQKDFVKSSIAIFINELIYKSIKEEEKNQALFDFLQNSIQYLDLIEQGYLNFHLFFAIQFTKYLGFFPAYNQNSSEVYFDLREGKFLPNEPFHPDFIDPTGTKVFKELLSQEYSGLDSFKITNQQRKNLLNDILYYYAFHLQGFRNMKSVYILETVLT